MRKKWLKREQSQEYTYSLNTRLYVTKINLEFITTLSWLQGNRQKLPKCDSYYSYESHSCANMKRLQWTCSQTLSKLHSSHVSESKSGKYTKFQNAHPFGILIDLHASTALHSALHFLNFWSHFCKPFHISKSCIIMHRPRWNRCIHSVLWRIWSLLNPYRKVQLKTIAEGLI